MKDEKRALLIMIEEHSERIGSMSREELHNHREDVSTVLRQFKLMEDSDSPVGSALEYFLAVMQNKLHNLEKAIFLYDIRGVESVLQLQHMKGGHAFCGQLLNLIPQCIDYYSDLKDRVDEILSEIEAEGAEDE